MTANNVGGKGRQLFGYKWLPPLTSSAEEAGPRSRFKHAACSVGPYLYVFGGKDHHTPLADIWRYHLVLHTWEEVSLRGTKIPHLQGHTATTYKRLVLLFGGELSDPSSKESPLWIFNTDLNHLWRCWVEQDAVVPQSRRDHSAVVYGNKLYIYGGHIDLKGSTSEFWAFNIDEEEWELLPQEGRGEVPGCRHGHSAVVHCKAMWVFGGMNNLQPRHDLCRYMFALRKWHRVKCLGSPPPLTGHTAHVHNGSMLVIGGESLGTKVCDVWILAFENCQWQRVCIAGDHSLPPCVKHSSILVASAEDVPSEDSSKDRSLSVPAFGSHLQAPATAEERPRTSPAILGDENPRRGKPSKSLNRSSSPFRSSARLINKIHPEAVEMDPLSYAAKNSQGTTPSRYRKVSPDSMQTTARGASKAVCDVLLLDDAQEEFEVTGSKEFLLPPQSDTEAGLPAQNNIEMLEMTTFSSFSASDYEEQTFHKSQLDTNELYTSETISQDERMGYSEESRSATKRASQYLLTTSDEAGALEHRCCCKQRCCDNANVTFRASHGWTSSSRQSHSDDRKDLMSAKKTEVCSSGEASPSLPQSLSLDLTSISRRLPGSKPTSHSWHSPSEDLPCFCCSMLEASSPSRLCMSPQQGEPLCWRGAEQASAMGAARNCSSNSCHCRHSLPELEAHNADQCYFCHGSSSGSNAASPSPCYLRCSSSSTPSSSPHGGLVQDLDSASSSDVSWVGSKPGLGKSKSLTDVGSELRSMHHQELLLEDLEWIDLHSGTDTVHLLHPRNLPGSLVVRKKTVGPASQASAQETLQTWASGTSGLFSRESRNETLGRTAMPMPSQTATQLTCQMGSAGMGESDGNQWSRLSGRCCCASSVGMDMPRLRHGDAEDCHSASVCREGSCLLPNQTASPSASLSKREVVCYNTMFEESLSSCLDSPMASTRSVGSGPHPPKLAEPSPSVRLYEKNHAGSRRQIARRNGNLGWQSAQSRNAAIHPSTKFTPSQPAKESAQHVETMEVETPYILVVGGQISFSASLHRQPLALWQLNLQ